MIRRHRHPIARACAAVMTALGALALFAPTAYAAAPTRVGWWNMVSASALVAPAPSTPSGGMHVAAGPGQVLSYGAVLYPLPAHAAFARLTLAIAGSQGTVNLVACPTKNDRWKAGDDQSADTAPAYDCGKSPTSGAVAADGKSVTFTLSTLPPKSLSIAIVPDLHAGDSAAPVNQPFSVDLGRPGVASLVTTTLTKPAAAPPEQTASAASAPVAAAAHPVPAAGGPLAVPKLPVPSTAQSAPSGAAAPPQLAQGAPAAAPAATQQTTGAGSGSRTAGTVIGALAMVAAFMFWGLGRGLLGGRIVSLSTPTRSAQP